MVAPLRLNKTGWSGITVYSAERLSRGRCTEMEKALSDTKARSAYTTGE